MLRWLLLLLLLLPPPPLLLLLLQLADLFLATHHRHSIFITSNTLITGIIAPPPPPPAALDATMSCHSSSKCMHGSNTLQMLLQPHSTTAFSASSDWQFGANKMPEVCPCPLAPDAALYTDDVPVSRSQFQRLCLCFFFSCFGRRGSELIS